MDILEKIKSYKLREIKALKKNISFEDLTRKAKEAAQPRGFADALTKKSQSGFALIAEIKKASPSKGVIRENFNPSVIARAYEEGGAACLSVLTDAPSFQGSGEFLKMAREACTLPLLRKDFLYDPYQVIESRALGADCILIILATLTDVQAHELEKTAFEWGMDVLLEVHNEAELERALHLSSPLIGINNRNLKTFDVTLDITKQLSKHVPHDRAIVAESGLFTYQDLKMLSDYRVMRFLIGESLMRQSDIAKATRAILGKEHS